MLGRVLVEVRPSARLRARTPLDLSGALRPLFDALAADIVDLARVRVVCDWVQYKHSFRAPVVLRPVGAAGAADVPAVEIGLDLRRAGPEPAAAAAVGEAVAALLGEYHGTGPGPDRTVLEDWAPGRESCIWRFNTLYWQFLDLWEKATGQGYEQALPGGETDARNIAAARDVIGDLFHVWDGLAERHALPDELYVVEFGVGNGNQARTWLDTFREMDVAHGRDYYRRLHYLMCDYSPHVLAIARQNVAAHTDRVSALPLDAVAPLTTVAFLRYKIFLVYISNTYDNLPTDEIASIGQREYLVETRAVLPGPDAAALAAAVGAPADELPALVAKLLRIGPALLADSAPDRFADVDAALDFWRRAWEAVRLEERYVRLAGLDTYELAAGVSGEVLRPMLTGGDLRLPVGNGAVSSFVGTMPLLHPYGKMICHDLFVTDRQQYRTGFRGPGKYDGSVVNWVNGPLLAHIGARKGFDVTFAPFAHRTGSNIVTMTAQVRD